MGTPVDRKREADRLKPYIVSWIRDSMGRGSSGGGGGIVALPPTPPPPTTAHMLATTSALGTYHTVSGLTAGQVLKALGPTSAAFGQLQHNQLGGIGPNDHHAKLHAYNDTNHHSGTLAWGYLDKTGSSLGDLATRNYAQLNSRTHDIIGADHIYTGGAALDVFGLSAASTLARLSPSADVSAEASGGSLLRSNAGALTLATVTAATKVRTPLIDTASGALTLGPAGNTVLTPGGWVELTNGKTLRTASFASGFVGNGFRIDQGVNTAGQTTLEVDNIWVRGRMHVYELLIHQIRATNGSIFVSNTGKIISYALYSGTDGIVGAEYAMYTDDDTAHGFAINDLIRAQKFTGTGVYQSNLRVTSVGSAVQFRAELISGSPPRVGYEYVRLGSTSDANRQGGLYMTADDSGAPFMDVWNGVTSFTGATGWGAAGTLKMRMGRLDGITGDTNVYGLWAGSQTLGNVYITGTKVALRQGTTEVITLASDGSSSFTGVMTIGTSGEIRQGTGANTFTPGAGNFTGLRMWRDTSVGRIGGYNEGTLQWYGSTDGKFYGGGGALSVGVEGIRIGVSTAPDWFRTYGFVSPAGDYAGLRGYYETTPLPINYTSLYANTVGSRRPRVLVWAEGTDTYPGTVQLIAGRTTGGDTTLTLDAATGIISLSGAVTVSSTLGVTGLSTLTGGATLGAALDTTTGTTLALKQGGTAILATAKTSADAYLQLGAGRTVDGNAVIRLIGDTTYTGYGAALSRSAGANGVTQFLHRGTGTLYFTTVEAAAFQINTTNISRFTISAGGLVGIGVAPATQQLKVLGSVAVGGDQGGTVSYTTLTNATSGVSSGGGTTKMNGITGRDSVGWLKVYIGTTTVWIPYWDTITG